ncbi:IS66 family insertion sequence element accessory protein TnpB [Sinorhizobium meliloti]|uniref:IS66 family insertion sequence element accessory protein TnpB n=1 Tax=Rhizobium meliloti TaxID=382 RepID=UPI002073FCBE|nr:IS66 family insertion sequence element accessory protein TnpB [Sinorhizobium meliloti]MCM5688768.1 IS66 family insertion sequence element accessory protein TnpB [Sinorhizobium meliloti]MDW9358607.1 IS66 family insertion sequence element accessory protein TnpB [Sinorhizobium meliloti]MDW9657953.1 IS66 family insertion sequence element accessory protein TnpB [Sinorhizobium meliloti]MDW9880756.1 IS66 family insertion sequence element accessory protein TnpB [Sinorhizobium meliloti]MDW9917856.1 
MFRLGADLKVYLHREPIDFRAGINSLAVLVQETMELDPFAPAVFAFCNRRRDRMKLLVLRSVRFCDGPEAIDRRSVQMATPGDGGGDAFD